MTHSYSKDGKQGKKDEVLVSCKKIVEFRELHEAMISFIGRVGVHLEKVEGVCKNADARLLLVEQRALKTYIDNVYDAELIDDRCKHLKPKTESKKGWWK